VQTFNERSIVKRIDEPSALQSFFGPNLFDRLELGSFCFCLGAKGFLSDFDDDLDSLLFDEPPPKSFPKIDMTSPGLKMI
jgi:hypothetical protein